MSVGWLGAVEEEPAALLRCTGLQPREPARLRQADHLRKHTAEALEPGTGSSTRRLAAAGLSRPTPRVTPSLTPGAARVYGTTAVALLLARDKASDVNGQANAVNNVSAAHTRPRTDGSSYQTSSHSRRTASLPLSSAGVPLKTMRP